MKTPSAPKFEPRRAARFEAELQERARAWIPSWAFTDTERDFARALLTLAARFSSEVAERLDRAGEKMHRGFLDWLAVRGKAARPARMPVVFKLADNTRAAVFAEPGVRLQADAGGTPVVFETETGVNIVPGRLDVVVGVDTAADAFYLPPPGLSSLDPLEPVPTQWRLKSSAGAGGKTLQLDPELGLSAGMILEAGGKQYRIDSVDKGIAIVDPPLDDDLAQETPVRKVTTFAPFDGTARNRQEHALYLGHSELLDIEAGARLEIVGAKGLQDVAWQYWGKKGESNEEADWQPLTLAPPADQNATPDAVVLTKPAGKVETRPVDGISSRWVRAYRKTVLPSQEPFQTDELGFRINAEDCGSRTFPCPPTEETVSPAAEAMANTTPLVIDNVFLPLGREPRQFDAFYLGSAEAFSKKGADVRICFELADPTFAALAAVRAGAFANTVLVGVGTDRGLHLLSLNATTGALTPFRNRQPLRPPLPALPGTQPPQGPSTLNLNPRCRPVVWSEPNSDDFHVAVAASGGVWIWTERANDETASGWSLLGTLVDDEGRPAVIDDIVRLSGPEPFAVHSGGRLWVFDNTAFSRRPLMIPNTNQELELASLVPLLEEGAGELNPSNSMVGVSSAEELHRIETDGSFTPQPVPDPVDRGTLENGRWVGGVRPAAVLWQSDLVVVAANSGRDQLLAVVPGGPRSIDLGATRVIGVGIEARAAAGRLQVSAAARTAVDQTSVVTWIPLDIPYRDVFFEHPIPSSMGVIGAAPLLLPGRAIVPGVRGDAYVTDFDPTRRRVMFRDVEEGVMLPNVGNPFAVTDLFSVVLDTGNRVLRSVTHADVSGGDVLYSVDAPFGDLATDPDLLAYRHSGAPHVAQIVALDTITLDPADTATPDDTAVLLIEVGGAAELYEATIDPTVNPRSAQLNPPLPAGSVGAANYWTPESAIARFRPVVRLNPATDGDWDASILAYGALYFPGADPMRQHATAFVVASGNRPQVIVLQERFIQLPPQAIVILEGALAVWQHQLADTSSNPELSWEYANGKGWWSLAVEDGTLNLKNTGVVRFTVPDDLVETDWSGRTNHWIRARLIGGDYGREKVTVTTTPTATGTEQTITRSTEGIRPPSIVKLHIAYRICATVPPTYVLARDSGSTRNQSDANRTPGAIVEAFVPLALALARLSGPGVSPETPEDCPPECECPSDPAAATPPPAATAVPPTAMPPPVTGRALFIGLQGTVSGAPVNVLLLVDEHRHEPLVPMTIEALIRDHFVPIVARDDTRALGESGLVSMTFSVPPTVWTLFGEPRLWLRLTPRTEGKLEDWKPAVRGAYLNATWASATETLTRELLGSSEGAPKLTLFLARPPVLRDTLELRVKEPLGEEERKGLRAGDPKRVLSEVRDLPGDWVLWDQVVDPGDEASTARVYALDEGTGEVRFGDGQHGAIPPVGLDSIVAFQYKRTEAGPAGRDTVPGNSIPARTPLNLVSPVEFVEAVFASDDAAGGAPPEVPDRVVRFGTARLRHRDRAVTAGDLEDLALQSSPDIVQARAFVRTGRVRLIVVMRGRNPQPSAAQERELRRQLLAGAPASLGVPGALDIVGPRIRRLRVVPELRVLSLDPTGELSLEVKRRIEALFDTATGGVAGDGWALGENPSEDDIALALLDTPHLASLGGVTLREVSPEGLEGPWPGAVKRGELVMLDADPVRLEFGLVEVIA